MSLFVILATLMAAKKSSRGWIINMSRKVLAKFYLVFSKKGKSIFSAAVTSSSKIPAVASVAKGSGFTKWFGSVSDGFKKSSTVQKSWYSKLMSKGKSSFARLGAKVPKSLGRAGGTAKTVLFYLAVDYAIDVIADWMSSDSSGSGEGKDEMHAFLDGGVESAVLAMSDMENLVDQSYSNSVVESCIRSFAEDMRAREMSSKGLNSVLTLLAQTQFLFDDPQSRESFATRLLAMGAHMLTGEPFYYVSSSEPSRSVLNAAYMMGEEPGLREALGLEEGSTAEELRDMVLDQFHAISVFMSMADENVVTSLTSESESDVAMKGENKVGLIWPGFVSGDYRTRALS
jgi:hypothetical protein